MIALGDEMPLADGLRQPMAELFDKIRHPAQPSRSQKLCLVERRRPNSRLQVRFCLAVTESSLLKNHSRFTRRALIGTG